MKKNRRVEGTVLARTVEMNSTTQATVLIRPRNADRVLLPAFRRNMREMAQTTASSCSAN